MVPYIIINGKSSRTIPGLLIQSLPPITKPKVRTNIEEIEGVDGDFATVLGYAAYDKQFSIGLHGDFDIDDIIQYFDSSGRITFSNEIDKYYKYAIYDQIDFNKLVRFRTATVKAHVQPFKYSIEEPAIKTLNTLDNTVFSMSVKNKGNIYSKPRLEIVGSGTITVYLQGYILFSISLSHNEKIIIDADTMNATDADGNYLNRKVTGDYNDFRFKPGQNEITFTGRLQSAKIENYSRWI